MMTTAVPLNWKRDVVGAETVLTFAARGGKGYLPSLLLGTACVLFFGYGAASFLKGWLINREEVLPAGVILFLILLGGFIFGLYVFDRLFYAATEYRMSTDQLRIVVKSFFNFSRKQIKHAEIAYVLQLSTPPKVRGMDDTWRTLIFYGEKSHPKSIALEGSTSAECEWLAPILAQWAGVPCQRDSTVSDA